MGTFYIACLYPKCILCFITGVELPEELSLRKCGVQNGDRLKLVLGMRGGPINMRRVALPSTQQKHVGQGWLIFDTKDDKTQIFRCPEEQGSTLGTAFSLLNF